MQLLLQWHRLSQRREVDLGRILLKDQLSSLQLPRRNRGREEDLARFLFRSLPRRLTILLRSHRRKGADPQRNQRTKCQHRSTELLQMRQRSEGGRARFLFKSRVRKLIAWQFQRREEAGPRRDQWMKRQHNLPELQQMHQRGEADPGSQRLMKPPKLMRMPIRLQKEAGAVLEKVRR